MRSLVSVVINTLDEAHLVESALKSVSWADEVVICDMHSKDNIKEVAKKYGARIVEHEAVDFVEPARNFAISRAKNDWVLILDPDEEVPEELAEKLQKIADDNSNISIVEIPRKNIMFGKWMKASQWWPDYNIRFFKKGSVTWQNEIHSRPKISGEMMTLLPEETFALVHNHYNSISQFIKRMDRYSTVQARELVKSSYLFCWQDLITKPLSEFLGRFFASRGFTDGVHGLILGLLQAFSFVLVYIKVWEMEKFTQKDLSFDEVVKAGKTAGKEINYWFKYGNLSKNPLKRVWQKTVNKII